MNNMRAITKIRRTFIFALILLTFPATVSPRQSRNRIPVMLVVQSHSGPEAQVASYMRSALRNLHDVDLVDANARYQLSVIVVPGTVGDRTVGYFISCVVMMPCNGYLVGTLMPEIDRPTQNLITTRLNGTILFLQHWTQVGPTESLKEMSDVIIADFDTKVLENYRKAFPR